MNANLLVSIVVITYNSSKTILETLESIKRQTYQNIELIITDDCSSDDTIAICDNWLQKEANRFTKCRLLSSSSNKGIGANCNKGVLASNGTWIKIIAGDDALIETCISDYINIIKDKPMYFFFHSDCIRYKEYFTEDNKLPSLKKFPNEIFRENERWSQKQQFRNLLLSSSMNACTMIYNAKILKEVGGFEEKISKSEDWPTWIKISKRGYKFYFVNKPTIKYRVNANSVYSGSTKSSIFPLYYRTEKEIFKYYIKEEATIPIYLYWKYNFFIKDLFLSLHMTKPTLINCTLFKFFNKLGLIWREILQRI